MRKDERIHNWQHQLKTRSGVGFTLIEMVLVVGISSVLFLGAATLLNNYLQNVARIERANSTFDNIVTPVETLRCDLKTAMSVNFCDSYTLVIQELPIDSSTGNAAASPVDVVYQLSAAQSSCNLSGSKLLCSKLTRCVVSPSSGQLQAITNCDNVCGPGAGAGGGPATNVVTQTNTFPGVLSMNWCLDGPTPTPTNTPTWLGVNPQIIPLACPDVGQSTIATNNPNKRFIGQFNFLSYASPTGTMTRPILFAVDLENLSMNSTSTKTTTWHSTTVCK